MNFANAVVKSVKPPSRALTIEHEPTGRELTQFKPEEARVDLSKIEVLAAYGAKLRDDTKLYELAIKKLEVVVDIVEWVEQHVRPVGGDREKGLLSARDHGKLSLLEAMEILGYTGRGNAVLFRWRQLAKAAKKDADAAVEKLVHGWKVRAGIVWVAPKEKKETDDDRDLAVEMIFRAYTKLDPDQRIELKQKIMAFEKSYKDPFKDAKEW